MLPPYAPIVWEDVTQINPPDAPDDRAREGKLLALLRGRLKHPYEVNFQVERNGRLQCRRYTRQTVESASPSRPCTPKTPDDNSKTGDGKSSYQETNHVTQKIYIDSKEDEIGVKKALGLPVE
jgi:hypothetical protein